MLFAYGFRTFFLAAALASCVVAALWGAALSGWSVSSAIDPYWHAHEMVFGFGGALVGGFVLTAVPNWTKSARVHGPPLMVLAALWGAGRAASFTPPSFAPVLHGLGALFLFGVAFAIARPIVTTANRRNYGVVVVVVSLAAAGALSAAARLGAISLAPSLPARVGVDIVMVLIAVVGGRIVPLFTKNATGVEVRARGRLDDLALASLVTVVLVRAMEMGGAAGATLLGAAGLFNLIRMRGWGTLAAARDPLLLVLHVGYLWMAAGLLLGALSAVLPAIPPSAPLHALTAGAMGTFGLGMMARVALGHTGRPLRAPTPVVLAFMAVAAGGLVRVVGPLLATGSASVVHGVASVLWTMAFTVYLFVYTPVLLRPRPDGRVG